METPKDPTAGEQYNAVQIMLENGATIVVKTKKPVLDIQQEFRTARTNGDLFYLQGVNPLGDQVDIWLSAAVVAALMIQPFSQRLVATPTQGQRIMQ